MADSKIDWNEHLDVAFISDIGMRRSINQDAFAINLARDMNHFRQRGHLFVVADGMGAHAAGELASQITADNVPHLYRKYTDISPPESLKRSVVETNAEIHRKGQANEEFHNMGTTCTALSLLPQGAIVGHVGDSRCYRLRGKRLEQMTFDHSLVWEMREANKSLTGDADISHSLPKNVITRSLGPYPDVNVDLEGPLPIEVGDAFLLCSDGLTGLVTEEEIGALLSVLAPKDAADFFVNLANLRGGTDNITILIIKILSPEMATGANDQPLTINAKPEDTNVSILYWVFFIAFLGAAIGAYLFVNQYVAMGLGAIAFALLARIAFLMLGLGSSGQMVVGGKRFGKGPYTKTDSKLDKTLLESVKDLTAELRQAAVDNKWEIDLARFDTNVNEALVAMDNGTFERAIRSYAAGVSGVMQELRSKKNGN